MKSATTKSNEAEHIATNTTRKRAVKRHPQNTKKRKKFQVNSKNKEENTSEKQKQKL